MLNELSLERLSTCHPDLQRLVKAVALDRKVIVLCGHRNEADQTKAYAEGHSKLRWPNSAHNKSPSLAVDLGPVPLDWHSVEAFRELGEFVKGKARLLGIAIEWGGDWKMRDYPHYQLVGIPRT